MSKNSYEIRLPNGSIRRIQVFENSIDGYVVEAGAVVLVDENGNPLATLSVDQSGLWTVNQGLASSLGNAWPVEITDGTNVLGTNAHPLTVQLTASPTINIGQIDQGNPNTLPNAWPVKLTDGSDAVSVNSDGSLNVAVLPVSSVAVAYNAVSGIVANVETDIVTVTAPGGGLRLRRVWVSGDNVSLYRIKVDGTPIATKRSGWTEPSQDFDFESGLSITAGQVLVVTGIHSRPTTASFEATVVTS